MDHVKQATRRARHQASRIEEGRGSSRADMIVDSQGSKGLIVGSSSVYSSRSLDIDLRQSRSQIDARHPQEIQSSMNSCLQYNYVQKRQKSRQKQAEQSHSSLDTTASLRWHTVTHTQNTHKCLGLLFASPC